MSRHRDPAGIAAVMSCSENALDGEYLKFKFFITIAGSGADVVAMVVRRKKVRDRCMD